MKRIGFVPLLEEPDAGPIIQTFLSPQDPRFDFEVLYRYLRSRGFAIYPGKLTKRPSFGSAPSARSTRSHARRAAGGGARR
jgi:2-aminoethylphosphonate-pyruvate transaminase